MQSNKVGITLQCSAVLHTYFVFNIRKCKVFSINNRIKNLYPAAVTLGAPFFCSHKLSLTFHFWAKNPPRLEIFVEIWDMAIAVHLLCPVYKGIYPKYSKHWPYTVAYTIHCVCSKMLNKSWVKSWVISFTFQAYTLPHTSILL